MKSRYGRTLMGMMLAASYAQIDALSIRFHNLTHDPIAITANVESVPYNYDPFEINESVISQYYKPVKSHYHHNLKPGQHHSFNYAKTKETRFLKSFKLTLSDDTDHYAVPSYQCDAKHNQAFNKKLLKIKGNNENKTVYIIRNQEGQLIASLSAPEVM